MLRLNRCYRTLSPGEEKQLIIYHDCNKSVESQTACLPCWVDQQQWLRDNGLRTWRITTLAIFALYAPLLYTCATSASVRHCLQSNVADCVTMLYLVDRMEQRQFGVDVNGEVPFPSEQRVEWCCPSCIPTLIPELAMVHTSNQTHLAHQLSQRL